MFAPWLYRMSPCVSMRAVGVAGEAQFKREISSAIVDIFLEQNNATAPRRSALRAYVVLIPGTSKYD